MAMTRIMFVCMGNICRSPTAHAVMQDKVNARGLTKQFDIQSSGTHAYHIGEPPDLRSQQAAKKRGIDMHKLRAQKLAITDYDTYDWILAMDKKNIELIHYWSPEKPMSKIDLLMSFAEKFSAIDEVPDPYYGKKSGFDTVLDLVNDACEGLLKCIENQKNTDNT